MKKNNIIEYLPCFETEFLKICYDTKNNIWFYKKFCRTSHDIKT